MKKKASIIGIVLAMATSIASYSATTQETPTTSQSDITTAEESPQKSHNDIRFGNWGDEEWSDNEYIRTIRKYIDSYNNGTVANEDLDNYKDKIAGQFVVANIEYFIYGGLSIMFFFIDNPEIIFDAWVYSYVDEAKEIVLDYELRNISVITEESGLSREQVLNDLKNNPLIKVW